jgi:transmembrane sensor
MNSAESWDYEESIRMQAAADWLLRLQEDKLNESRISEWIEWCESDSRNLQAFEQLQSLWRATVAYPPNQQQLSQLKRCENRGRFGIASARIAAQRSLAVAASVAVCLAAAVLMHGLETQPAQSALPERTLTRIDSVETPLATNQRISLPDGSNVEIGARSALDVDFAGDGRKLQLRYGQAYFRVKHDPIHPFVVDTGGVQVVAVGTAFDVRRSDSQVAVTVQEGAVKIFGVNRNAPPVAATAGYQLTIDTSTGETRRSVVDPSVTLAWRAGRLEFTGDTLDVVIASVNRYSQRTIILGDPALGKLAFTGTVFVNAIDESLDALQQVFPIEVKRTEREVILLNRP